MSPEKPVAAALRAEREEETELRTPWMVWRSRWSMTRFSMTTRVGASMMVADATLARKSVANFIVYVCVYVKECGSFEERK